MGVEFQPSELEQLLDQLLLIGEQRENVKRKTIALLQWKKGGECPIDVQELRNGIDGLEKLERFNHTNHMIFRDYVGPHSERVTKMHGQSQYIFQYTFGETYNIPYGNFYSAIHDILEGVSPFGDIITTIKDGLSPISDEIIKVVEGKLAELVMEHFFDPCFASYPQFTQQAFGDMIKKRTLECKSVSYIDKACDGFMYTFHELIAGNRFFIEYFQNYTARIKDIYSGGKLPEIQALFQISRKGYIDFLEEIHGDYPENMKHFGDAIHLYDRDMFLAQESRIEKIIGLCPPDEMGGNLEEDFGFPAYGIWKKTMLLLPSITQERRTIRERGKTLLTIPTKLIVPERI